MSQPDGDRDNLRTLVDRSDLLRGHKRYGRSPSVELTHINDSEENEHMIVHCVSRNTFHIREF